MRVDEAGEEEAVAEIRDVGVGMTGADVGEGADGEDPVPALRDAFAAAGISRGTLAADDALWFGDVDLLEDAMPDVRLRRAPSVFEHLRSVKDASEIEHIPAASAQPGRIPV